MGNYVTIQDIRDEGVTLAVKSDALVTDAIEDAERDIEGWCNRWFYRRTGITLTFDGGNKYYVIVPEIAQEFLLPVPILSLTGITIDASTRTLANFIIPNHIGPPVDDRWNPRIISILCEFPLQGIQNIALTGDFGFVEDTTVYKTPRKIKLATKLLVIKHYLGIKLITDIERDLELREGYLIEEEIPGHRIKLDDSYFKDINKYTGDPEIDGIIYEYSHKKFFGAV